MRKAFLLRLLGAVCLAAAPIAVVCAQTLADIDKVMQQWPGVTRHVSMKSARFVIDPKLRRTVATPEIEKAILDAAAATRAAETDLANAQREQEKADEKFRDASTIFEDIDKALKNLMSDALALPDADQMTDEQKSNRIRIDQGLGDLQRQWIAAREALDEAIAAQRKTAVRTGRAENALEQARKSETGALNERVRWFREHPGKAGAALQRDVIVIRFRKDTPIAVADALLHQFNLTVVSGIPSIALLITQTPSLDDLDDQAADRLRDLSRDIEKDHPFVLEAYPNIVLGPLSAPMASDLAAQPDPRHYSWFDNTAGTAPAIAMRFPAAWNFNDAIKKAGTKIKVAVFDVGFSQHDDLDAPSICEPIVFPSCHGNMVLGIIGAKFDNGTGVVGGTPFAEIVACAAGVAASSEIPGLSQQLEDRAVPFTALAQRFDEIARQNPPPRVINVSLGYRWGQDGVGIAETRQDIRDLVDRQGATFRALVETYPDIIVVSAAGNDCDLDKCESNARWTSPFNWAALGGATADNLPQAQNVFVVQSDESDTTQTKAFTSSDGGTIAGPGVSVFSTTDSNDYRTDSGTSMATPQISALVTNMLAYNPLLSVQEIRSKLDVGIARMPNAYISMARAKPLDFARDLADLNHDGKVDMDDFNDFAKDLVDYETGTVTGVFTRDLNRDHSTDGNEAFFPRADLNGDGKISRFELGEVPAGQGGSILPLTDLGVMMLAWTDSAVKASELPGLLAAIHAAAAPATIAKPAL
jgi:subtilisin family serine protease